MDDKIIELVPMEEDLYRFMYHRREEIKSIGRQYHINAYILKTSVELTGRS